MWSPLEPLSDEALAAAVERLSEPLTDAVVALDRLAGQCLCAPFDPSRALGLDEALGSSLIEGYEAVPIEAARMAALLPLQQSAGRATDDGVVAALGRLRDSSGGFRGPCFDSAVAVHCLAALEAHAVCGLEAPERLARAHETLMLYDSRIPGGEYRPWDVRVGPHVPPPHREVPPRMEDFWAWRRDRSGVEMCGIEAVADAGAAHAVYETIHPFADGNGRTGRLLAEQAITATVDGLPAAFGLSGSFCGGRARQRYYRHLDSWRRDGPEAYLRWWANAVQESAQIARTVLAHRPAGYRRMLLDEPGIDAEATASGGH